jgi:hypothetical protein
MLIHPVLLLVGIFKYPKFSNVRNPQSRSGGATPDVARQPMR